MINFIVYSKDRPSQLELFIRSCKKFFKQYNQVDINVLYKYSNEKYKIGYNKLIEISDDNIIFTEESNFKQDTLSLIDNSYEHVVFFVDDIFWKDYFSLDCEEMIKFKNDNDILTLSLRLHQNLNYCYTMNVNMKKPKFIDKNIWFWKYEFADFGYPMSLDGHIFRTKDIYPKLKSLNYRNPNSLESSLSINPINKNKIICLDKSCIINNPCNKVQTENSNRYGIIPQDYINEQFLNNKFIDMEEYEFLDNESCHKELKINFK